LPAPAELSWAHRQRNAKTSPKTRYFIKIISQKNADYAVYQENGNQKKWFALKKPVTEQNPIF